MDFFLPTSKGVCRDFIPIVLLLTGFSSTVVCQDATVQAREVVSFSKDGKLIRKIGGKKNKFRYDDGGSTTCLTKMFKIKRAMNEDDPCRERYVRDFIWQHLQDKKRGYIRITYVAVDTGTNEHFFIEPDEKGIWSVSWWSVWYSALPPGRHQIHPKRILFAEKHLWESGKDWTIKFKDKYGIDSLNMPNMLREH